LVEGGALVDGVAVPEDSLLSFLDFGAGRSPYNENMRYKKTKENRQKKKSLVGLSTTCISNAAIFRKGQN
jgi:hypothetical protein